MAKSAKTPEKTEPVKKRPEKTLQPKKSASSTSKTEVKGPAARKAAGKSSSGKISVKASGKTSARSKSDESDIREAEVEIIDPSSERTDGDMHGGIDGEESIERFDPTQSERAYELASQEDIDPDSDVDEKDIPATPRTVDFEIIDTKDSKAIAAPSADPIATYLAEIRRYPLLTKEQERELALRYRETGDARAAELLVTSNLRFVVKIAAEYSRFGAKLIDLVQEGNVGLMHAVREFNPYKGVRLITYAVWWIRGYIQEYLMRQYSLVRIGTTQNQRKLFYRLQKEKDALEASGQQPTVALLAGRLGVTEDEVETMSKRLSGRDVSLNQPLDSGGGSAASLLDFEPSLEQAVDESIGAREELEVLRENIEKIRSGLSEKELYVLENRLLSDEPMTLQEIGDHYKVTREAVRQLEARLIQKLRKAVVETLEIDGE